MTKTVGFFATLVWVIIVGLNILLLAQVIETFFPAMTKRWEPPYIGEYVGSYEPFAVIMGLLVTFTQAVLGIAFHRSSGNVRYLFLGLAIMSVAGEAGLDMYRTWLIGGGIVATGFIGLVIPVIPAGGIILGVVAYENFLMPIGSLIDGFFIRFFIKKGR